MPETLHLPRHIPNLSKYVTISTYYQSTLQYLLIIKVRYNIYLFSMYVTIYTYFQNMLANYFIEN